MNIFQGEPIVCKLRQKEVDPYTGEEHYVSSFTGYVFEALMKDSLKNIVYTWKSSNGSITTSQETVGDETAAYATWSMAGSATADLKAGLYSIEIAKILNGGRGIGLASDIILVKEALIKEGI